MEKKITGNGGPPTVEEITKTMYEVAWVEEGPLPLAGATINSYDLGGQDVARLEQKTWLGRGTITDAIQAVATLRSNAPDVLSAVHDRTNDVETFIAYKLGNVAAASGGRIRTILAMGIQQKKGFMESRGVRAIAQELRKRMADNGGTTLVFNMGERLPRARADRLHALIWKITNFLDLVHKAPEDEFAMRLDELRTELASLSGVVDMSATVLDDMCFTSEICSEGRTIVDITDDLGAGRRAIRKRARALHQILLPIMTAVEKSHDVLLAPQNPPEYEAKRKYLKNDPKPVKEQTRIVVEANQWVKPRKDFDEFGEGSFTFPDSSSENSLPSCAITVQETGVGVVEAIAARLLQHTIKHPEYTRALMG